MVAASAGHGLGLCDSYQDREACHSEDLQMPYAATILVEYTRISLALHSTGIRAAIDLADSEIYAVVWFDLGSDERNAGAQSYDDRVRHEVLSVLRETYQYSRPPKMVRVIMTGESADEVAVQVLIRAVVEEFASAVEMLTSHPEYVAARGAAELAWRAEKFEQANVV